MLESNQSLTGKHPKFLKSIEFAKNLSVTRAPVLIIGEAGTGKRTLCQFIHQNSARNAGSLFVVDCAREDQEVQNDILGYRDAEEKFHKGVLEMANQGTVVLANIDALNEDFQKRLYSIFQELKDYDLDIRVLATTTKNLSKFVGAGRFHRALYTYFAGAHITLTPLRDRVEDIYLLAKEFANNSEFTEEALTKLSGFYWTHNIAELKSVIENAVQNSTEGVLDINAIELGEKKSEVRIADNDEGGIRLMSLKEAEQLLIKKALVHTSENRTQAAKILGVSIRTLRNKINEYRGNGENYFVNLR